MAGTLLANKVVLVTGSTTGIGEAVVRRCVAEGAQVMIHGRREEQARELSEDLGEVAAFVVADLADSGASAQIVQAVIDRFGRVDALVNNAALTTRSNLDTMNLAVFDRIISVNLRAPLFLIQAAMPHFRRQGGGTVLNIGSVNAYCGEPNLLIYSMSKGALMTMTRNLADAHSQENVRINQLNVGWTLTENERKLKMSEGLPDGWENKLPKAYAPYGRIFMPEEVASHVVFWISDAAGPVNGAVCELEQYPMIGRNPHKEGE